MDSLGSEIGQKMRSAVKAKLIELGTGSASGYIDDELPDYVMIMVANKRSRQQMIDDLTLFLAGQTEVFVNWLHQVLQKLEEVTLPAGSAAATAASTDGGKSGKESSGKRKKEEQKKDKKKDKKTKRKEKSPEPVAAGAAGEHTPPHPGQLGGVGSIQEVFANQYIQQAKKTLEIADSAPKKDPAQLTPPLRDSPRRNEFDIPTISEIAGQTALQKHQKELSELEEIQQKIKQAKKQLKEMGSDESEDEDFLNIKANDEDLENIEDGGVGSAKRKEKRKPQEPEKPPQKDLPEERSTTPPAPPKKKSILERLGSRPEPKPTPSEQNTPAPEQQPPAPANKSNIISLSAHRREERELYIPVFRRKEMEEKAREAAPTRSRQNRSRSRERDRRRRESSRERSRNRRERERERERERRERRDRERERSRGGGGKVSNGGGSSSEVRARIGSRVIVLPPKPEYVEEDELEVPIPSVIKIQPRPQVPKNKQPSKNLLLKAMAEAQRSTAANLKKTISNNNNNNNNDAGGSSSSSRPTRMLIEIPGHKPGGTPPTVDVRYAEEDDDEEIDIVNQVLLRDDDVDEELQQILDANDEYIPEPVTISISGRSDTDSDGYVYVPAVKKASSEEQTVPEPGMDDDEYDPKDPAKNPKFVVTLDGVYKKSSRASPSHTPPPPAATSSKPSIKDRIGKKVDKSPARDSDDRDHQETLKRRKERFSLKAAAAAAAAASKRTPSRSPEKRPSKSSSSSSKRSPTKKRSPNKNSKQQPPRASPADLNELLLQRTKELLVDDSVSSSPIYMSKSDYEKIEPNSSSRKRKRVSPIQFELTDDDEEANDSDGEYNHHRDREHRERKPIERRISLDELVPEVERRSRNHHQRDQNERGTGSRTVAATEKVEHGDQGERKKSSGGGGNNGSGSGAAYSEVKVSPTKKIKKLESSRKFDDVPQLLSSVSVPAVDGLLAPGVGGGGGSKSKSLGLIKERCKYFPSCRQGEACEFLHPSTPCKAFPACKFGDSCLYLHPYCKFDKTCHRLDCNYMHSKPLALASAGPSAPPLASSVVPVQNYKTITAKPLPALCKFYPGCTNGLCPYYHPKMCRFGRNCMNKVECNFYHHDLPGGIGGGAEFHEVPSKDKFKWISPFSA